MASLTKSCSAALAIALASAVLAVAGQSVRADDTTGFTTISLSGSTAMRTFITSGTSGTTSSALIVLPVGQSLTLNVGEGHTATGAATGGSVSTLTPASTSTILAAVNGSTAVAANQPLRVEWREQGSVEGIYDLVYSWNGSVSNADNTVNWGKEVSPTATGIGSAGSGANTPIWVNNNKFTSFTTVNGWSLAQQNRVQVAVSDVVPVQGFQVSGTGAMNKAPGTAGYGVGNPNAPVKEPLSTTAIFNNIKDEQGNTLTPGATPVTTLLNSTTVVNTSTLLVANPGTGLEKLNQKDAQWVQTASRLANGATFNMSTRDAGSGTRNVAANNTGVDPSWAVGLQDGGIAQQSLGNLSFSLKTAGGSLRSAVQIDRMAIGTLSNSDAHGSTFGTSSVAAPLRALSYSDSQDGSSGYVAPSTKSMTDGSYVIFQNEQFVTLKTAISANNA
ncbi:MAG: hypothetical protein WCI73_19350, partial [Phycisphaerae bacterium]